MTAIALFPCRTSRCCGRRASGASPAFLFMMLVVALWASACASGSLSPKPRNVPSRQSRTDYEAGVRLSSPGDRGRGFDPADFRRMRTQSFVEPAGNAGKAVVPYSRAWTVQGPANYGGKVMDLAVNPSDPNTVVAGYMAGGAWKTTDGGLSWNRITDLEQANYIASVALWDGDPNVIFLGLGSPGYNLELERGVIKSTDGGLSWRSLGPNSPDAEGVYRIVVDPTNADSILIATEKAVFRTTDGGATWAPLHRSRPRFSVHLVFDAGGETRLRRHRSSAPRDLDESEASANNEAVQPEESLTFALPRADEDFDLPSGFWTGRVVGIPGPEAIEKRGVPGLPTFTRTIIVQRKTYRYTMVGSDPFLARSGKVVVPLQIIPVRVEFNDGTVLDPTLPLPECAGPGTPLTNMLQSPLFTDKDRDSNVWRCGVLYYWGRRGASTRDCRVVRRSVRQQRDAALGPFRAGDNWLSGQP